jgi:hypothetical protein
MEIIKDKIILEEVVYNATKEYFKKINVTLNNSQISNAVATICCFLLDEDLLIEVVLRSLYPKEEVEEVLNDEQREDKKNEKKSFSTNIER